MMSGHAPNKRILRDIHHVGTTSKEILAKTGIYYSADESNLFHGTAMFIGQKGTPYHGGFYFFDIMFPTDYPFSPLKVRSLTQDGITRFNPNMYVDGKVCLSILNTWHDGPQWTSVQSLESVLLVIMADVLNAIPLNNEPIYHAKGLNEDAKKYNRLVFHSTLDTAILRQLKHPPAFAEPFKTIMNSVFPTMVPDVLVAVEAAAAEADGRSETFSMFSMTRTYRFAALGAEIRALAALGSLGPTGL